jgi:hypothetical protein
MKKLAIIITFVLAYAEIHAQATTNNGTPNENRFGFSVGYFGDKFSNRGYQIGVENYLSTTRNFNVVGSILLSNYFVTTTFTALSLNPRIGLRHTANIGVTMESHLGLGYLLRSYKYNEYDVNEQGQVVSKGKASQSSIMPNLAFGIGYDFRRKTKMPILYFARGSVNYNYPNKHALFEASYALETGFIYFPTIKKKLKLGAN